VQQNSSRNDLLLLAYNSYIESENFGKKSYCQTALEYVTKASQICLKYKDSRMEWRTCHNFAKVYLEIYDYQSAMKFSTKSMEIAEKINDTALISLSYLDIAKSLEGENQKNHALANYLIAADMADKIGSRDIRIEIYRELSGFFRLNKLFQFPQAVGFPVVVSSVFQIDDGQTHGDSAVI